MGKEHNKMVRLYGKAPYSVVLVHGGPGAIGALKGFAKELSKVTNKGTIEAIQSKYSAHELVEELVEQIQENGSEKVTLIGHSWGAWLVAIFAAKYPSKVDKAILLGCPPLEDTYVWQIGARRLEHLQGEEKAVFDRLIKGEATDEDLSQVPTILEKADNYCLEDKAAHQGDRTDSEMFNKAWTEAAKLRSDGRLIEIFKKIECPLYLIQGEGDPHPSEGVTHPLEAHHIACETHVLPKCGHSPYMEKYAKESFYQIVSNILNT